MNEPRDSADHIDHSDAEISALESSSKELSRSEKFHEDVYATLDRSEIMVPLLVSAILFYLVLAWLVISPVIEAFWPRLTG